MTCVHEICFFDVIHKDTCSFACYSCFTNQGHFSTASNLCITWENNTFLVPDQTYEPELWLLRKFCYCTISYHQLLVENVTSINNYEKFNYMFYKLAFHSKFDLYSDVWFLWWCLYSVKVILWILHIDKYTVWCE